MKLHNAIILKILTAELETEKNSVWANLNDTNDIIIVKSHEFEKTLLFHISKNGYHQTLTT